MLEKDLHLQVCNFLRTRYPNIIFRTDFAAGMRMSIGMARRQKALQSHSGYPDLFIIEPRGMYNGMFIELKREDNYIFKKDGSLRSNAHHEEQSKMLKMLKDRGFEAVFGQGYSDTISKITKYLDSN